MTTAEATILQQQTVFLLRSFTDSVDLVDEVSEEECCNCGAQAPVWIHGPSTNAPHCEMDAAGWCFFYGHEEDVHVEVRRLPETTNLQGDQK